MSDKVMNGISYAGAGVSATSALTLTDLGIIVGIATALLTFAANLWYQHRKDRREEQRFSQDRPLLFPFARNARGGQTSRAPRQAKVGGRRRAARDSRICNCRGRQTRRRS